MSRNPWREHTVTAEPNGYGVFFKNKEKRYVDVQFVENNRFASHSASGLHLVSSI